MDRWELLHRITAFPLSAGGLSEELLAGGFRSVFKGQGIEFDEARHYQMGDDARFIDWNASARFGEPYVKMYREEREFSVFIILDCSPSMRTSLLSAGPEEMNSYEQAVLAAALIAFSAEKAGQRVGALFFDRDITQVFPPRKGRPHIMAILAAALESPADSSPPGESAAQSNLRAALVGTGRFLKRRSMVVALSDFFCSAWEDEFEDLAIRHDLIALGVGNPPDGNFPGIGLIPLEDPETGVSLFGLSKFSSFRKDWSQWTQGRRDHVEGLCRRAGADCVFLPSPEETPGALSRFFGARKNLQRVRRRAGGGLQ
ncbi:MAG: DUF58 domain-containing protein [Treponema sp.]|jgi:uncharacterized protein (DUF58 family)|nr:DUF58 domain-containing protein [Treponema sp.]